MNRVTVILLAIVILLAHGLAIHQSVSGEFAAPYEIAHVAFRLARNVVHEGLPVWNPGEGTIEAYPSAMWVAWCSLAERLYLRTGLFAQGLGMVSMLATVAVLAQFSPRRMSGLVAPLLLAASGSAAAAGTGGTEAAWMMLLITTAFLAFERGYHRAYAVALALAILTSAEGAWLALFFALLDRAGYHDRPPGKASSWLRRHALPMVVLGASFLLRRGWTGTWLSAHDRTVLSFDSETWVLGFHYIKSFFLASGSGWLILLPFLSLPFGLLSSTGLRALGASVLWFGLVESTGGDGLPLWHALAPILPLFFLSIQEAMTAWMDRAPRFQFVAWALLTIGMGASLLVSKTPSNFGPFPLETWQRAWMTPDAVLDKAYGRPLGRLGLAREIREVERLRSVGPFLRSRIGQAATILTPWPGTVACMSRKRVQDLLGRTQLAPGNSELQSWRGTPRVDLIQAFSTVPDYVVPVLDANQERGALGLLHSWLARYDSVGDTDDRMVELLAALANYELVSAPVESVAKHKTATPYLVLRNRKLGLSPRLELSRRDKTLRVLVHHAGPQQIVDLQVRLFLADGSYRTLRPTGDTADEPGLRSRTDLMLYPTGTRPICLLTTELPLAADTVRLEARLLNPGSQEDSPLSTVGSTAVFEN